MKFRYLKINYNASNEGKQLQNNYICYMNVKLEWEKVEDEHCACVCVCVCLEGGNSVREAAFRTENEKNSAKKLKTCIYTHVDPSGRAVKGVGL